MEGVESQDQNQGQETVPLSNVRGRSRGRPRSRGDRGGRNPLHVRERIPPKGSRPRGGLKGVKRGPRKAVEPSDEFKTLKSQATLAYLDEDFDKAQELVQQAISINPEIFSAYALLSSIHQASGDEAKAVAVLFQGAHTRPSDGDTWKSVAQSILDLAKDRQSASNDAIYCYTRAIAANRDDIESRRERAQLYVECGRHNRAVADYKNMLRLMPHDLEILRCLSECYSREGHPQVAITYYDEAIAFYRLQDDRRGPWSFWSDANIYAELYWLSKKYAEGLLKIKQLARWLLGRGHERFWDEYQDDDREFDANQSPRRLEIPEYHLNRHEPTAYGLGLPLELRVKLGLFRLKVDGPPHQEAMVFLLIHTAVLSKLMNFRSILLGSIQLPPETRHWSAITRI